MIFKYTFFHWLYYQKKKHFIFNASIGIIDWFFMSYDLPFGTSTSTTFYFITIFILFPFAFIWPFVSYTLDFFAKKIIIDLEKKQSASGKILLFKLLVYVHFYTVLKGVFCYWECISLNTYIKSLLEHLSIFFVVYILYTVYAKYLFTNKVVGQELNETEGYIYFHGEGKSKLKLKLDNIIYINSDDNYVDIITSDENKNHKTIVFRATLKSIATQLKSEQHFIRIHRSFIINLKYLDNYNKKNTLKMSHNQLEIELPVSKNYQKKLLNLIS